MQFKYSTALKGTLLYALAGGLWILFSDRALNMLVTDPALNQQFQTYKGWLYVTITSLLLYVLLRRAIKQTRHLLQIDSLTLLPKHYQFSVTLDRLLEGRQGNAVIMMDVDINHFSRINEEKGHLFADEVLKTITKNLKEAFPDNTLLGRLGADSFGIAIEHLPDNEEYDQYIERLFKTLSAVSTELDYAVQASVGIAIAPSDGVRSRELITHATSALHALKGKGEGLFGYYSRELSLQVQRRQTLIHALRDPDCFKHFSLVYQPQFNAKSRQITGVEVLCRWHHPDLGHVSPAEFIPIAEDIGLSSRISHWVIHRAFEELQQTGCFNNLARISINISATEFNNELQLRSLARLFSENRELARRCQLEITETAALRNPGESTSFLHDLKSLGLRLSIDDFGTGYTSLDMLRNMPVDEIKIDRVFIQQVDSDDSTRRIVQSIIDIALNFGINCIAEGVETESQLTVLTDNHCPEIQGYLLSKPVTAEQLCKLNALQGNAVSSVNYRP